MRRIAWMFLIFALLLLASCAVPATATAEIVAGTASPTPDEIVAGYLSIIDTLYDEDPGMNSGIKTIAVDTSVMNNLDRAAKDKLLKAVERKHGCTVLDETLRGLESKGYVMNSVFTDGIAFVLKDSPPVNGIIKVEGQKTHATGVAVGYTFDLEQKAGVWAIARQYGYWVS